MSTKSSLTILNDFMCLGADCPDDCCHGWNLHIDSQTLIKWKSIKDEAIRSELCHSVSIINENNQATEVVQQQSDGSCIFLSKQGLCTIQQRCGHEFLPETCREYPRVEVANETQQLHSAQLSCPGIVQLLAKQKLTDNLFRELSENTTTQQTLVDSNDIGFLLASTVSNLLFETSYTLGLRLYFIATVLQQLANEREHGNDAKRRAKICRFTPKSLQKQLSNIQNQFQHNKLKFNKKLVGHYWQFVFDYCRVFTESSLKPRIERSTRYQALVNLNQLEQPLSEQDYLKHYQLVLKLQKTIPKKVTDLIDSILTPVMQVKFKNHGFPWFLYKNSLELTYLDCLVPYSQINLVLWLLYESEQKLTEQDIITVIYKVEKTVAHNTVILEQIEHQPELLQIAAYAGCWLS